MKISYKKIKVIRKYSPQIDRYYGLMFSDFFSDDEIREMDLSHIRGILMRSKSKEVSYE